MRHGKSHKYSVSPGSCSLRSGDLGDCVPARVEEGMGRSTSGGARGKTMVAVFPVEGDSNVEELEAAAEQEYFVCPPCLPTPYQPTRSEYLDHCTTHFPFRAWCRHCLEGRGREFGHANQNGTKEQSAAPVVSFD